MKIIVLPGQSLMDVSIQVYGSPQGVFTLANENGMEVTDELKPGQALEYSLENVIDKQIVQHYDENKIHPATAFNTDLNERIFDESFDLTFK